MNKITYILQLCLLWVVAVSCNDFLDENPKGALSDDQLNTPDNVEKMVIAAYSGLGNDHYTEPNSPWPYGNLRSGDAYKGGAGTGDIQDFHFYETFTYMRDDLGTVDSKWYRQYVSISRINNALSRLNAVDETDFAKKQTRIAEMRFLRGHFYFEQKILFKHVPYIDETVPVEEYITVSNKQLSDAELWNKIIADFRFAVDNLPENNEQIGRANKWMSKAYLAKVLLYAAYEQDDKNNVVSINQEKLNEVVQLTTEIIESGRYALSADFADNFLFETENGPESIFAVQHSRNDGTLHGRLDWGAMLNYPMNPEYGCCGFHQPSQNLVNAFQTTAQGLPKFTDFNQTVISTPEDLLSRNIDPRLNHTVAIPGLPYKYNPEFIFQEWWNRQPEVYGAFMSMKEVVLPDCGCFEKVNPFMSSSKNRDIIRFDDVILWKAEALIELNREAEALPLINQIRERASRSTSRLKDASGNPTGKFVMAAYRPGVNCTWDNEFARQALRWERRLEFAMEGCRFFDLVRWGIAAEYINSYFEVEKTRREHLREAKFTKNRDEYFPIPMQQINFSKKLYQQNYGW